MSANVDVIRAAYDAFAEGDVPAVLAVMSPDIVWNEADDLPYADGNPYIGPDAVMEGVFARLGRDWDPTSVKIEHVLDAGDNVVVLGRYEGRHSETGSDLGMRSLPMSGGLEDGKLTRFQQYTNTAHMRDVMRRR